jgi:hypothetical protein
MYELRIHINEDNDIVISQGADDGLDVEVLISPDQVNFICEKLAEAADEIVYGKKQPKINEALVKDVVALLQPGVNRGPIEERWVWVMKELSKQLNWTVCGYCHGDGCSACTFIGRVDQ